MYAPQWRRTESTRDFDVFRAGLREHIIAEKFGSVGWIERGRGGEGRGAASAELSAVVVVADK